MRVISMVPSLTEMLLECGVDVVGRTRFCHHPQEMVKNISVVGGTKDIDWERVKSLQADLLLLDQEENPKQMSVDSPIPWHATHICSVKDVAPNIESLMARFAPEERVLRENLHQEMLRWKRVEALQFHLTHLQQLPGVLEWLIPPPDNTRSMNVLYMIWKKPWMAVSSATFIGSVLSKFGLKNALQSGGEKTLAHYPEVDLQKFDPQTTVLLFSSEPFPFAKFKEELKTLGFSAALVDGESFSWFGRRSLLFLESSGQTRAPEGE